MRASRRLCRGAALVVLAATVAAGCAPTPIPTRFYVLSTSPPAAGTPAAPAADFAVGVGPVTIPAYLARPQVVTRTGRDEVDLAEFDQWGEPLRPAVQRVLAENLALRIPTQRVILFPWRGTRSVQYQVAVDILRFEGRAGGDVVLEARWRLLDGTSRELLLRKSALTEATGAPGYPPMVAALSRALGALSGEIAAAIAGVR